MSWRGRVQACTRHARPRDGGCTAGGRVLCAARSRLCSSIELLGRPVSFTTFSATNGTVVDVECAVVLLLTYLLARCTSVTPSTYLLTTCFGAPASAGSSLIT